jgi:hypothetical protein
MFFYLRKWRYLMWKENVTLKGTSVVYRRYVSLYDGGLIPGRGKRPAWLWAHLTSYSMSTGASFLGG